jgi:hypothetical protein
MNIQKDEQLSSFDDELFGAYLKLKSLIKKARVDPHSKEIISEIRNVLNRIELHGELYNRGKL